MDKRMPDIFGTAAITSLDQWKALTKHHSNECRSAYLVGHSWLGSSGAFPPSIKGVMMASPMRGLRPVFSVAEHITVLDSLLAPSRTDLMVYCQDGNREKAVIAVEGKVTERFDEQIRYWIRDVRQPQNGQHRPDLFDLPVNNGKRRRLNWLSNHLGLSLDDTSVLRYQLIHRTVDALLEANHIGARSAIMLVQAFAESEENWSDYSDFAEAMGFTPVMPNSITEAKVAPAFPEIGLRLGWVYDLSKENS